MERVMEVLNCEVLAVRIAETGAVYSLGLSSGKTRKDMGECGCVPLLIKMLDGKGMEEKEAIAMALSVLLLHPGNKRIFRKDERGIVSVVHRRIFRKDERGIVRE
ncbi:Armadillo-type fold [Sesbania bispinosa]|nr:Armadillo-type fold [Sesbania bispinosa]